jgi:hypothetical protein
MEIRLPIHNDIVTHSEGGIFSIYTSPESVAQALSALTDPDLLEIVSASEKLAATGLEISLARLEQSDRIQDIEQAIAIMERMRSHLRWVLTAPTVYDAQVGGRIIGDRVLTADERARIVAAVGDDPKMRGVDIGSPDGDKSIETIARREGDKLVIDSVCEIPAQYSGEALVGVECYFADIPKEGYWTFPSSGICDDFDGKRYRDQYGMRWNHARPAALGLPS